jgi:hypothetical protein
MSIQTKTMFVKTHHSIEMMKRYHELLSRIYSIIVTKMFDIELESTLKMSFKTLNDSSNFDDLNSIFLIFDAYFKMTELDALSATMTQRAIAMKKTINKIKRLIATR